MAYFTDRFVRIEGQDRKIIEWVSIDKNMKVTNGRLWVHDISGEILFDFLLSWEDDGYICYYESGDEEWSREFSLIKPLPYYNRSIPWTLDLLMRDRRIDFEQCRYFCL